MKIVSNQSYKPSWWLQGAHLQTLWPTLMRTPISLHVTWERIELPDGDFVDIVWEGKIPEMVEKPLILILHGLGGGMESPYLKGIMKALSSTGFIPLLMHFRGGSGVPNRIARGYHSGDTQDMAYVVNQLKVRFPNVLIGAVGFSLGGNALLKWLGETGASNPLSAAVAISVPFQLNAVADKFMKGFGKVYQWWLLRRLKEDIQLKFAHMACPFDLEKACQVSSFWEFDDLVTAPLNGFGNVHTYYKVASCRQYLSGIDKPTLIIHAEDDPFMVPSVVPFLNELAAKTTLELSKHGGHVGFIEGNIPFKPSYWLEKRVPEYFSQILEP